MTTKRNIDFLWGWFIMGRYCFGTFYYSSFGCFQRHNNVGRHQRQLPLPRAVVISCCCCCDHTPVVAASYFASPSSLTWCLGSCPSHPTLLTPLALYLHFIRIRPPFHFCCWSLKKLCFLSSQTSRRIKRGTKISRKHATLSPLSNQWQSKNNPVVCTVKKNVEGNKVRACLQR